MKVTILRSTQADGGKSFDRGDTPDLPEIDARILIADGAAVRFTEPAPAEAAAETASAKGGKKATAAKAAAAKTEAAAE